MRASPGRRSGSATTVIPWVSISAGQREVDRVHGDHEFGVVEQCERFAEAGSEGAATVMVLVACDEVCQSTAIATISSR